MGATPDMPGRFMRAAVFNRCARLCAALAIVLALMPGPVQAAPVVQGLRAGDHGQWTRFVLELDSPAPYRVRVLSGGRGVSVAFDALDFSPELEAGDAGLPGRGLITRIRAIPGAGDGAGRLLLETARPVRLRDVFLLQPEAGHGYRLVIDLEPAPAPAGAPERLAALPAPVTRPESVAEKTTPSPPPPAPAPEPVPPPSPPPMAPAPLAEDETWAPAAQGLRVTFSGFIEAEVRAFPQSSRPPGRKQSDVSIAFSPRLEIEGGTGRRYFVLAPFVRGDARDDGRSHVDIREMKWVGGFGAFELRLGVDRLFWGVTESVHLADVVNQWDFVEDIDNEDRLGQPLVSLSFDSGFGTVTGYFLPYFRTRTFPGAKGRPGFGIRVDTSQTQFEAANRRWHRDWAVRWAHSLGPFDIGIAHFSGTGRTPRLLPGLDSAGQPVLIPRYDLIRQTSLDLQATLGALLLKFEGVTVKGPDGRYQALAGGFEYTLYQIFGTAADLGVLAEYLYDDRGRAGPSPFEDDLFVGFRLGANDAADSQLLAGAIFDLDTRAKFINIEGQRRMGQSWLVSIDARLAVGVPPFDPLFFLGRDDFVQIRLGRYF